MAQLGQQNAALVAVAVLAVLSAYTMKMRPWLLLVILALGTGYGDGSWNYPIARGQYVQFGIITVITAGSFAALYLIAYWAAKRWPR